MFYYDVALDQLVRVKEWIFLGFHLRKMPEYSSAILENHGLYRIRAKEQKAW